MNYYLSSPEETCCRNYINDFVILCVVSWVGNSSGLYTTGEKKKKKIVCTHKDFVQLDLKHRKL